MKKVLFLLVVMTGTCFACSSPKTKPEIDKPKVDVPEFLLTRFANIYPTAENVVWEIGKNRTYEVSFTMDKQDLSVIMLEDGGVQQTEVKVDVATVPPLALTFASESLGVKKIDQAFKVVDGFGVLTWKIRINHVDYLFTSGGQLIGKMAEQTGAEIPQ
jgi:hypothetical protein